MTKGARAQAGSDVEGLSAAMGARARARHSTSSVAARSLHLAEDGGRSKALLLLFDSVLAYAAERRTGVVGLATNQNGSNQP